MNVSKNDSQTVSVSSPQEIHSLLSACVARRQPAVTVDSDILQTYDYRSVLTAVRIDLSRLTMLYVSPAERIARMGPGAKYSTLLSEAGKAGMVPEFEPVLGIDFSMSDWAHESLRMVSTSRSGLDGVIRNVKAIAPTSSFQTGFDTTPANGGGYDLTKLYMSSAVVLGVPYEFAVPLRPIPESESLVEFSFDKLDNAVKAGMAVHRGGLVATVNLADEGLPGILREGEAKASKSVIMRIGLEGTQTIVENAHKLVEEVVKSNGGKAVESGASKLKPMPAEAMSDNAVILGVCTCDTSALPELASNLSKDLSKSQTSLMLSISELTPTACTMVPVAVGKEASNLAPKVGQALTSARIPLRGNIRWNPLMGDSDAFPRRELVTSFKRYLDPSFILNPQVLMEAVQ